MPGAQDLENFVVNDLLQHPECGGTVSYAAGTFPRPWFRTHVVRAFDIIQTAWYSARDGDRVLLSDGNWRGMETDTSAADPTYTSADTEGIAYPAGFKQMKYVYLVNTTTGKVRRRPLESVTEEQYNTQIRNRWGADCFDNFDDDWIYYYFSDPGGCPWGHDRLKWMDKEGQFVLTHTPQNTLTLRMTYYQLIPAPVDPGDYTANNTNWIITNLFNEIATLTAAMLLDSMGEDGDAKVKYAMAEQVIGDKWRLNQDAKSGSNSRVFIPQQRVRRSQGW